GGGINVYDETNAEFYYVSGVVQTSPSAKDYVSTLLLDNNTIWSGTKGGLQAFDVVRKTMLSLKYINDALPTNQVTQLIKSKNGDIWFSTFEGEIISLGTNKGHYFLEKRVSAKSTKGAYWSEILTMVADDKGNIWIGGQNSGLSYID